MYSKESKYNKMLIYGLFIILLVSCFTGWRYYIDEPLDEDLGGFFVDSINGIRITTFSQVIERVKYIYLNWSGRIPGYFLIKVSKLFPRTVSAVACALIFSANVILTIRIVVKDTIKALSSPLLFLVLYLALYWYRPYIGVCYRWEFVALYSFTVTLVLLYYNLTSLRFVSEESDSEGHNCSSKKTILMCLIQTLGVITGMCHEILSFGLIALLGTEWIVDLLRHKAKPANIILHGGLAIGYLIGLLSPGNFKRLNMDWTKNAYSESINAVEQAAGNQTSESMSGLVAAMSGYIKRIGPAFDNHEITIMGLGGGYRQSYKLFLLVFVIAIIAMVYMLLHGQKKDVCNMIVNDIGFIVSSISSVIMWAFVYWQPSYVVWLPTIFVYIAVLEFAIRIPDMFLNSASTESLSICRRIIQLAVPGIIIVAFIILYGSEVTSFARTSLKRRERIAYAQENSLSEITIPRYDEDLSPMRYSMYCLNDQNEYDNGKYTLYYGVHLIIED